MPVITAQRGDPAEVARKRRRRAALTRVAEKAIERLDRLDGDPDLEDSHDVEPDLDNEASLCGVTFGIGGEPWGPYVDLEEQCDDEGHVGDLEPSSWSERSSLSGYLDSGSHEDAEDDGCGEPSLAAPEGKQFYDTGNTEELEAQCEDEGVDADLEPDDAGDATYAELIDQRKLGMSGPLLPALDPDEAPDTLASARAEAGLGGPL